MVLLFSAIDGMSSHFLSEAAAAAFACSVLLPFYFWIPFFLRMWIDFHWFSLSNINISWQLRRERWTNTQLQSSSMYYIEQREAETTTTLQREGERKKERKQHPFLTQRVMCSQDGLDSSPTRSFSSQCPNWEFVSAI